MSEQNLDPRFLDELKARPNPLPPTDVRNHVDSMCLWIAEHVPPEAHKAYTRTLSRRWELDGKAIRDRLKAVIREIEARQQAEAEEAKQAKLEELPEWEKALSRDKHGEIKSTIANAIIVLTMHPEWEKRLAYSTFRHEPVWRQEPPWDPTEKPNAEFKKGTALTDEDATRLQAWLARRGIHQSAEACHRALDVVARKNEYHDVQVYLRSLTWDSEGRVETLFSKYAGAADTPYTRLVARISLVAAVARALNPGCKAETLTILEGPQGRKKSQFIRDLFGKQWFSDTIADLGTKDSYQELAAGVWCLELAELDKLNRAEVTTVKQFLSVENDRYRPSYGRRTVRVPRQCVLWGSVNAGSDLPYLKDQTGNRRFLPIEVGTLDLEGLNRDRDQLWAEAVHLYLAGTRWWADTPEEVATLEPEQDARRQVHPWDQILSAYLAKIDWPTVTVGHLLNVALKIPAERQQPHHASNVGQSLRRLGWHPATDGSRRYWVRPGVDKPEAPTQLDPHTPGIEVTELGSDQEDLEAAVRAAVAQELRSKH